MTMITEGANAFLQQTEFAVQVIASGGFVDDSTDFPSGPFTIETWMIRLNAAAQNEWMDARPKPHGMHETPEQWEAAEREQKTRMSEFRSKLAKALDIDQTVGSLHIESVQMEIYAVVHTYRTCQNA